MKNPNHKGDDENKSSNIPSNKRHNKNQHKKRDANLSTSRRPSEHRSEAPPSLNHTTPPRPIAKKTDKSPMTSTLAIMSSSSVISPGKSKRPGRTNPAKKTPPQKTNPPATNRTQPPDKRGATKPSGRYAEPLKNNTKNANTRPSMARMIEAARNAEARRRAENPDILGNPDLSDSPNANSAAPNKPHPHKPNPSGRPGATGTPGLPKSRNARKSAPPTSSHDDVKTAGVLKKAAEAARAKKDLTPRAITYHKKPSQSTHTAPQTTELPTPEPRGDAPRSKRIAEAMRHLKETANQENNQPGHRYASQQRLAETLAKMNLNNPTSPILLVSLTHPSYTFENPNLNKENNQRLEFLGDAVLDFIVGEYLYLRFPDKSEGELTKIRAAVVNESTLAQAARGIQLGQSLFLGRGEQVSGGRERASILADALEAVIGAYYLQEGFETARQFVLDLLVPIIDEVNQDHYGDFKTLLQEVAQHDERTISYRILDELGPDHNKSFTAGVYVQGVLKGKGTGKTKKEAEQQAARLTLENWEVPE